LPGERGNRLIFRLQNVYHIYLGTGPQRENLERLRRKEARRLSLPWRGTGEALLYRDKPHIMARKDSDKESERPHYYSQFWLDVAAGRRVIGTPRTSEEAEPLEAEAPEPVTSRKAGRAPAPEVPDDMQASADGQAEAIVHPTAEPEAPAEEEEYSEPEEVEVEEPVYEEEEPEIEAAIMEEEPVGDVVEDEDIPDMDLSPIDEEEDIYDEEEEEEDVGWGRGRKKAKPGRQVKPPKRSRRDTRRGF
jgi:hypothetical protein